MGGICGLICFDDQPVAPEAPHAMAAAAAHRGPDGIRLWSARHAALAHLALHLTPEATRDAQPLAQDGLVLTASVRLDNREELTRTLATKGCLAKDVLTDAALILAAYRLWGLACAEHLLGDFAFALWDAGRKRLFAARDAMAMRPFYYRVEPRRVLFASEVKQILAVEGVEARLFEPAIAAHLAGHFDELTWTFYEGISQLAPAHALVVDRTGVRTWRYWDIDPAYRIRYKDEREYAEHFRALFAEAVRCRLRSTKPVGVMLSGGMDSGSIASMGGWLLERGEAECPSLRSYSWAFEELSECDERHISDGIVRRYGLAAICVAADEAWPLAGYPLRGGPDRDEPYVGVYQELIERTLAAARAEGVRLMLSGDRGDLMVGDWIYDHIGLLQTGRWQDLWNQLQAHSQLAGCSPRSVVKTHLLRPMWASLWPEGRAEWLRGPVRRMSRRLSGRALSPPYPVWVRRAFAERVELAGIIEGSRPRTQIKNLARRQRYQHIFSFASMRWVMQSERSSARFGLGFADPWSDRRLARFVLAVPQHVLHRPGDYKRLAKRAMRGVMPEGTRQAVGKIEPESLFERGFKERGMDTVLDLIGNSEGGACGYLDEQALHDCYASFLRGEPQHDDFWWALTLEMWLRQHGLSRGR